jgi:hypothetical protein
MLQKRAVDCLISSVSTNISRTSVLAERHSRLTSCFKVSDHIPELCHFPEQFCFLPELKQEEVLGCTSYGSLLLIKPNTRHRQNNNMSLRKQQHVIKKV